MADRLIALGRFGAPQGVRGELRVKSYTGDPKAIAAYGPLTDAAGVRRFALTVVRPLRDDMLVARVEGVASREAAAALTGVELFARRVAIAAARRGGILSRRSRRPGGGDAGRRRARPRDRGHQPRRRRHSGDRARSGGVRLMVAFTKQSAPEIDFAAKRIVVIPPPEIE